ILSSPEPDRRVPSGCRLVTDCTIDSQVANEIGQREWMHRRSADRTRRTACLLVWVGSALVFLCAVAAPKAANLPTAPYTPPDREAFVAGIRKDCRGCDLREAKLKRRDLSGADLTGADLTGAVLHRAKLINARLDHAKLQDANLNKADLKRASLKGADLSGA